MRDRAGAFFFNFRFARRADAEFEIGGRDGEAIAFRLTKKIREDGNRRLAFDDTLRQLKFFEKIEFLYAEFHLGPSSHFIGCGYCTSTAFLYSIKYI